MPFMAGILAAKTNDSVSILCLVDLLVQAEFAIAALDADGLSNERLTRKQLLLETQHNFVIRDSLTSNS